MRKILPLLFIFLTTPALPDATVCASNDDLVVMLNNYSGARNSNINELEFMAKLPIGTIFGIAALMPTDDVTRGTCFPELINPNTGNPVKDGESFSGTACYCKLTHPMESGWCRVENITSAAGCGYKCGQWANNNSYKTLEYMIKAVKQKFSE